MNKVKHCPTCTGRGRIYEADYDSAGRYVRYYRCQAGHQWKTAEDGFTARTPHQVAKTRNVHDTVRMANLIAELERTLVSIAFDAARAGPKANIAKQANLAVQTIRKTRKTP